MEKTVPSHVMPMAKPSSASTEALAATPDELDFFFAGRFAPVDIEHAEPMRCADCGHITPSVDLLFTERGSVCLSCHGENEVAYVDLSPWRHAVPTLLMIVGLAFVAVTLPQVAQIVLSLGPTGAIAWAVMNLLPASFGVFLVIAAMRLLRDAWTNPLDEELPRWASALRMAMGMGALLASALCTLAFPVMALWPFV
ncbi:MAG: hypothetical protein AAGA48_27375 [Myxococcota bacterium]